VTDALHTQVIDPAVAELRTAVKGSPGEVRASAAPSGALAG
jgi:hypothetical protein